MRTITKLSELNGKVYVYLKNSAVIANITYLNQKSLKHKGKEKSQQAVQKKK